MLTVWGRYSAADVNGQLFKLDDEAWTEAIYAFQLPRHLLGEHWFDPIPYLGVSIDTELTPTLGESYRQLELGGALGVRFIPVRPLELNLAVGLRREMLHPEGNGRVGILVGYDLPRFSSIHLFGDSTGAA